MRIRTAADIAALEIVPVGERIRHTGVADMLEDAARRYAGQVAIRYLSGAAAGDPVRDVTFHETRRRVIQTANLLHRHGIGPQDTVTLLMPSVPETFFALWGAQIAAVANPVNYFLEATQIAGCATSVCASARRTPRSSARSPAGRRLGCPGSVRRITAFRGRPGPPWSGRRAGPPAQRIPSPTRAAAPLAVASLSRCPASAAEFG